MKQPDASKRSRAPLMIAVGITLATPGMLAAVLARPTGWFRNDSSGVVSPVDWPEPLQRLISQSPALANDARVFKIDGFVDQHSVWLLHGHQQAVDAMIASHELQPAGTDHPKLQEFLRLLPDDWPKPSLASAELLATRGYGTVHQEGIDLFLVIRDGQTGITFVMHEWIF